MEYEKIFKEALEKDEVIRYLRGEFPYEIEYSQYMSDVEPTDINCVLMRAVYTSYKSRPEVKNTFEDALEEMLCSTMSDVYTAILYFDACLYAQKQKRAGFLLNINRILPKIQKAVSKNTDGLSGEIEFPNGLIKKRAWNIIEYFDKTYRDKYGFGIIVK